MIHVVKMDPEIKKEWVKTLPTKIKLTGKLGSTDGHRCCLGVLSDILEIPSKPVNDEFLSYGSIGEAYHEFLSYGSIGEVHHLPSEAIEKSGVGTSDPFVLRDDVIGLGEWNTKQRAWLNVQGGYISLSELNDAGDGSLFSFQEDIPRIIDALL